MPDINNLETFERMEPLGVEFFDFSELESLGESGGTAPDCFT